MVGSPVKAATFGSGAGVRVLGLLRRTAGSLARLAVKNTEPFLAKFAQPEADPTDRKAGAQRDLARRQPAGPGQHDLGAAGQQISARGANFQCGALSRREPQPCTVRSCVYQCERPLELGARLGHEPPRLQAPLPTPPDRPRIRPP